MELGTAQKLLPPPLAQSDKLLHFDLMIGAVVVVLVPSQWAVLMIQVTVVVAAALNQKSSLVVAVSQ